MAGNEVWTWLLAGLAGMALGAFFFGGLWWTVRQTLNADRSMLWHVGGWLVRMTVTLLGFYAVGAGQWQRLMACLAGFILARMIVMWVTRGRPPVATPTAPEGSHAPQP